MSENKICLRLLGLSLAHQPGVTQRYIAKNRPLTCPSASVPWDPCFQGDGVFGHYEVR